MWQNRFNRYEEMAFKGRLYCLFIFLFLFFILIIFRLFYLQIIEHSYFKLISEENRIYSEPIKAPRGCILSREGKVFVGNRMGYSVVLSRYGFSKKIVGKLSKYLDIDEEYLLKEIELRKSQNLADILISRDIPDELMWNLSENLLNLKGVKIVKEHIRDYRHSDIAAHLFGYISEITKSEIKRKKKAGYLMGDYIGKIGLEKQYEMTLKGQGGFREIETDAYGHKLRVVNEKKARYGSDIITTINFKLERRASALLKNKKGSIIVLDAKQGDVLVMVSSFGYDSNQFLYNINVEKLYDFNNPNSPMLNRAIQATYPPASTFKIVTTIAALEEKVVKVEDEFECRGGLSFGQEKRYAKCWKKEGHGYLNFLGAFKHSCDVYYYNLALKIGWDKIFKYAEMLGYGVATEIDLPYEARGFLPTRAWKKKKFGVNWYNGDTVNASIGQGFILSTPLQVARMLLILLNENKAITPFLVKGKHKKKHKKSKLKVATKTKDFILRAMFETVNDGTGQAAAVSGFDVCGKTGTAENPHGEDHAWFLGFAPFDDPKFIVCILIENGGGGGSIAAPIAQEVFKACQ
ncbi:MAG: penicillin-binding protein 2 [bacterium]|nr:penicillin-binding protein 2 [bacterium]